MVEYDVETGMISVYNDGQGIPIVKHKKHGVYVPELIFGHLLTSSNYDVRPCCSVDCHSLLTSTNSCTGALN